MASNYILYTSTYKNKITEKLSYSGYTYSLRNKYKGSFYYYCDHREICQASLIRSPDQSYKHGRNGWGPRNKVHVSHEPSFDKTGAEMVYGRLKKLARQHPELPTSRILSMALEDVPLSVQVSYCAFNFWKIINLGTSTTAVFLFFYSVYCHTKT